MFSVHIETYLAFVAASTIFIAVPGPNVAVIVATSIMHGVRSGLLSVAGTSTAMAVQLAIAVFGMSAILSAFGNLFEWLRWLGAAYLIHLGVKTWRVRVALPGTTHDSPVMHEGRYFWRGFVVSISNPKTLLFHGALLPQFVDPAGDATAQLVTLAATFAFIAIVLDSAWACGAARSRPLLRARIPFNKISGGFLVGAGVGLALARK